VSGFVDLRLNHAEGSGGGESFWPSFTDIMMVVMMIFMIASTVLVMRNWELVAELRATMHAQEEARAEQARALELVNTTSQENATLEERLAQSEHQLSLVRMRLMQADEERTRLEGEGRAQRGELELARTALQQGRLREAESSRRIEQLNQRVHAQDDRLTLLEGELGQASARLGQLARERDDLLTAQAQLGEEKGVLESRLSELEAARSQRSEELADLREEYSQLKVQYDKLVRPARSAAGKRVVEVRYERVAGEERYRIKEPGSEGYREVARAELEQRLDTLRDAGEPGSLYVKIIIPEQSGLSYNEAWRFTSEILNRYDYYYVE